jgi:hypothetical protein
VKNQNDFAVCDSGRVNSWIKVSDLRDPEVKQKSEHSYESRLVLRVEKHRNKVAYVTRLQSIVFKVSGGGEKSKGHL